MKMTSERGQGLTEYVIILALIAVTSIVALKAFGHSVRILFGQVTSAMHGQTYSGDKASDVKDEVDKATESRDLSDFDKN